MTYGASAPTSQSTIHFFYMQKFGCMLNYNDNVKWNISFS